MLDDILNIINEISAEILFVWIPSHLGIKGNEKVDLLAKTATNEGEIYEDIKLEVLEYNETIKKQSGKMSGQAPRMVNSIELLNPMYLCRWNMNIQIGWKKSQLLDFA